MSHTSTLFPAATAGSWATGRHDGAPLLVIGAGPKAIALAKFLKGQDLKPRTCILNGERKDMFKG